MKRIAVLFTLMLLVLPSLAQVVVEESVVRSKAPVLDIEGPQQRRFVIMHQRYNFGVNLGYDPKEDSIALVDINTRMDSIRQHRPTVGLVLSGGGAKGAAHVGVIRYLESLKMPVDLVVGTSMGGLIGGLYSLGYNGTQIDSIVRNMDWSLALSDKIPREYITYSEMKYKEKYILSIPFYYEDQTDTSKDHYASDKSISPVSLGADDSGKSIKENLLSSLPSAYIYGHNVNDILVGLSVGYHDSLNFNKMPIPYACVATDLVSGKGKVWHSGNLPIALRSTMSIPGVYAPVKLDGMVLVDGGMRDNFPVDLARRMGADIVIGVDLSSGFSTGKDINNLIDIMSAGIDMMGREAYELNSTLSDVTIKPDLKGFNMMSFNTESVDVIINRGYEAAVANAEQLKHLKEIVGPDTLRLQNTPAKNINGKGVYVKEIEINGVTEEERLVLLRKIGLKSRTYLNRGRIEKAEAAIMGTMAFDYIEYSLLENDDNTYNLVFNCKKGPVHRVGVGARVDMEELVSGIINVGFNVNKLEGSTYDLELKLSANPRLNFTYSYDRPDMPTYNVGLDTRWMDMSILDYTKGRRVNYAYFNASTSFYLSNIKWNFMDVRAGFKNDVWYHPEFAQKVLATLPTMYCTSHRWSDFLSLFLDAETDTTDDSYFPTRGIQAGMYYQWSFLGFPVHDFDYFHSVSANIRGALSIGERFTFLPSLEISAVLGQEMPIMYANFIGGSLRGRYISQQQPFMGINGMHPMDPFLTILRGDFRFRLAKNHYLTGVFNYARDGASLNEWVNDTKGWFGAGIIYSYNTILGPIDFDIHWSNLSPMPNKFGAYFSIGYHF